MLREKSVLFSKKKKYFRFDHKEKTKIWVYVVVLFVQRGLSPCNQEIAMK